MKTYIGIDNGVTGTITIISSKKIKHFKTPIKSELSYTKAKQNITRIDKKILKKKLKKHKGQNSFCLVERPMINPMRFKASMSGIRALEAILITLEELNLPYAYIDSKEWQKHFLPRGVVNLKGQKNKNTLLKKATCIVAKRLFPKINTNDADSILIAEYARRKGY